MASSSLRKKKLLLSRVEEVVPSTLEDLSPSLMLARVLGILEPKEEEVESGLGDDR